MSELINKTDRRAAIRRKLLAGVSGLALTAYVSSLGSARAEDADRPVVWLEVGGQLSALQEGQEAFAPSVMNDRPSIFEPSQKFDKPSGHSFDEIGAISIQPSQSDWVFSASIRYGRAKSNRHNLQQTSPLPSTKYPAGVKLVRYPYAERFAETNASSSEQHAILDFEVGKDVGLGMFGSPESSSLINVGVRFAQFSSKSNFTLKSDPDWQFSRKYFDVPPYFYHLTAINQTFHSNLARMTAQRSFHGIGPSVSWKSSVAVAGNVRNGEIFLDWGINGAALFGRQRAQTHHQTTVRYLHNTYHHQQTLPITVSRFPVVPDHTRSRTVTVPNIGGFAGVSFRYANAKISAGYRADLFLGAMDGGIDAAKKENVGFYGPFASVSVGLGG